MVELALHPPGFLQRRTRWIAAWSLSLALCPMTHAQLVESGFELGEEWDENDRDRTELGVWPDVLQGDYAFHATHQEFTHRCQYSLPSGTRKVSVFVHFRLESHSLRFDPSEVNKRFDNSDLLTLVGVLPKSDNSGLRPAVGIQRSEDHFFLKIQDYDLDSQCKARDIDLHVDEGRWHTLELSVDQDRTRMKVFFDGVKIFQNDNAATFADASGTDFTMAEFGALFANPNINDGYDLWFDNVAISIDGEIGPNLLSARATGTPGVGPPGSNVTTSFDVTSDTSIDTVSWDVDGDDSFDYVGAPTTVVHTYTSPGAHQAVVVVDSGAERTVAYPPPVIVAPADSPLVSLEKTLGGDSSFPFPRTVDYKATISPQAGRRIASVDWDWTGRGVYKWNSRTHWDFDTSHSTSASLQLHASHSYPFKETEFVARVRVTDDAGDVAVAELPLVLPNPRRWPNRNSDDYSTLSSINPWVPPSWPAPTRASPRRKFFPGTGLYATYRWDDLFRGNGFPPPADCSHIIPWVDGVDVGGFNDWSDLEPAPGSYAFGPFAPTNDAEWKTFNGRLQEILRCGKNAVLHTQAGTSADEGGSGGWPSWLWNTIASSDETNSFGEKYPMFWDPRYLDAYRRFVLAYAQNIADFRTFHSDKTDWGEIVLVRGQSFTVDPEILPTGEFPVTVYRGRPFEMELLASNFTHPTSDPYRVDFTPELATAYDAWLKATYVEAFGPLGIPAVFKANSGGYFNGWNAPQDRFSNRASCANSGDGLFATCGSEDTCFEYLQLGFSDDPRVRMPAFTEQTDDSNYELLSIHMSYWTFLAQLNAGTSCPSLYADRLKYVEYQAEFDDEPLFEFLKRNVGWKAHPNTAPEAWIALKPETNASAASIAVGNYGAFLNELPGFKVVALENATPDVDYDYKGPSGEAPATASEPMRWAKRVDPGGQLALDLDDRFHRRDPGPLDWFVVEVVYLDTAAGKWELVHRSDEGLVAESVPLVGDGDWKTHRTVLRDWLRNAGDSEHPDLALRVGNDGPAVIFHRIVVRPYVDSPPWEYR